MFAGVEGKGFLEGLAGCVRQFSGCPFTVSVLEMGVTGGDRYMSSRCRDSSTWLRTADAFYFAVSSPRPPSVLRLQYQERNTCVT